MNRLAAHGRESGSEKDHFASGCSRNMAEERSAGALLRTKLHRPPVPEDYVHRPRLMETLDQRRERPLTLVSAPAGYGKSVLTSSWLEASAGPGAWLSLDEQDNDLRVFLSYFLTAVRTLFPSAAANTLSLLNAPESPPPTVLAHALINELDELERDFILVLDDIHLIRDGSVYDLLAELLRHPPRSLHLVLVGRQDPKFVLPALRASGRVTEIRIQDLRFTASETLEYLQQVLGERMEEATASALARKSEGWVTGLHLAVLAMRSYDRQDQRLLELKGTTRYVTDYLISEVLGGQPRSIRRYLLNTSILNRFSAGLCDALNELGPAGDNGTPVDGREFIRRIQESGLFVIPLDAENQWYRYHHLFQQLLHDQLNRSRDQDEVAALHRRAGAWFEERGFIGEALHHFLTGGVPEDAGRIVALHGHALIDQERVVELEGWLRQLPRDVIHGNPMLLVFEAWIARFKRQIPKIVEILDRVEALLRENPPPPETSDLVVGYMSTIRSYERYCMLDTVQARAMAERAVALVTPEHPYMRGFATIIRSGALQMSGRYADALSDMNAALADPDMQKRNSQAVLTAGLGVFCLIEADYPALRRAADRMLRLVGETDLPAYRAWGRLYLACSHYQCNEVEEAARILARHLDDRYLMYPNTAEDGAVVLAFCHQIMGRPDLALQVADLLTQQASDTGNAELMLVERALQADLALRQGRRAEAIAWARTCRPGTRLAHYVFYLPDLTLARILAAENTPESRRRAQNILSDLERFSRRTHNRSILIPVLALQSLLADRQGEEAEARAKAAESLALAEPGGGIRFFLDLGPAMADLLKRLRRADAAGEFIDTILAAFDREDKMVVQKKGQPCPNVVLSPGGLSLVEPLTNRELDILELLPQRLRDKEIAERLFIAPATVKKHLQNIYRKLEANNRRQALENAQRAGIALYR